MAITFLSASSGGGSTNAAVSRPAGVVAGDLLIAIVGCSFGGQTITPVQSWNLVRSDSAGSSPSLTFAVYWRLATASEASVYEFGTPGGTNATAVVAAYTGVNTSSPIQVQASTPSAASKTITAPSVVATGPGVVLTAMAFGTAVGGGLPVPSGTTRRGQFYTLAPAVLLADAVVAAAGATPAETSTVGTAWPNVGVTVVLRAPNTAPNAPTLTSPPTGGSTIDLGSVQRFAWTFSDPDAGDSQSKFDLQYRIVGASTWTTVSSTTPNAYYDFAAGTFAAGSYEWQVRTYDAQGVVGPFSSSSFFTAAVAPPAPTITAPVNGSTVSSSATVTWSAPNQTGYRIRRVADNAGAADTSTVYYDSGLIADSTTRSVTVAFPTNNRWEHVEVEIQNNGLLSTWADARVLVSFTPPATPTRALTADSATATITVAITNPAPGAGEPAVAYNDVYVDDDDGLGLVRKAAHLAANATWTYRLPRSGVDYDGRIVVRAVATNGTTADSA